MKCKNLCRKPRATLKLWSPSPRQLPNNQTRTTHQLEAAVRLPGEKKFQTTRSESRSSSIHIFKTKFVLDILHQMKSILPELDSHSEYMPSPKLARKRHFSTSAFSLFLLIGVKSCFVRCRTILVTRIRHYRENSKFPSAYDSFFYLFKKQIIESPERTLPLRSSRC